MVQTLATREPSGPNVTTPIPGPQSLALKKKMDPLHVNSFFFGPLLPEDLTLAQQCILLTGQKEFSCYKGLTH